MGSPVSDIIRVANIPGLEPEEQPLAREADSAIPLRGNLTGEVLGNMNSTTEVMTTAGEFASNLKRVCANCKHFDTKRAQEVFAESTKTPEGRKELNHLKANLITTQGVAIVDGDHDVESALSAMGVCHVISDITRTDVITHPLSFCPVQTYGDNFKPIDRAAAKRGEQGRDKILRLAEGRDEP